MRPINLRWTATKMFATIASVTLCSIAFVPGTASYEVYLNHESVIKEHLYGRKEAPTLPLNTSTAKDELSVTFNNCGKIDTARKISLKDEQDKTLKEWSFSDSPDIKNQMVIRVSEITGFKNQHSTAKLVYSSRELPTDVHLVTLQLGNTTAQKSK
ncbi:MAG TPA: hypothetical protein VK589_12650 [Chryseolinea sp.]|nr:hypothetical protein [Chryseolinea sp.]